MRLIGGTFIFLLGKVWSWYVEPINVDSSTCSFNLQFATVIPFPLFSSSKECLYPSICDAIPAASNMTFLVLGGTTDMNLTVFKLEQWETKSSSQNPFIFDYERSSCFFLKPLTFQLAPLQAWDGRFIFTRMPDDSSSRVYEVGVTFFQEVSFVPVTEPLEWAVSLVMPGFASCGNGTFALFGGRLKIESYESQLWFYEGAGSVWSTQEISNDRIQVGEEIVELDFLRPVGRALSFLNCNSTHVRIWGGFTDSKLFEENDEQHLDYFLPDMWTLEKARGVWMREQLPSLEFSQFAQLLSSPVIPYLFRLVEDEMTPQKFPYIFLDFVFSLPGISYSLWGNLENKPVCIKFVGSVEKCGSPPFSDSLVPYVTKKDISPNVTDTSTTDNVYLNLVEEFTEFAANRSAICLGRGLYYPYSQQTDSSLDQTTNSQTEILNPANVQIPEQTLGVCVCDSGYSGVYCEITGAGPCLAPNIPVSSFPQGFCSCSQEENYSGKNCELKLCMNSCSYRGDCNTTTGICTCYENFYGPDCSIFRVTIDL